MQGITIDDFKKYLNTVDEEILKSEVLEIFNRYPDVRRYYHQKLNICNAKDLSLEKMKIKISKELSSRMRINICINIINEYKKMSTSFLHLAELMIHFLEETANFLSACEYDSQYFQDIYNVFEETLQIIAKNNLEDQFTERAYNFQASCLDVDYSFGEEIMELFYSYLSYDE